MGRDPRRQPRGIRELGLDDQRIPEPGLGDLGLARGTPHAVVRKGGDPVGGPGKLRMAGLVVVGAGEDPDPLPVGVIGEPGQHRNNGLAVRDVEASGRVHEVHLGVDVPDYLRHAVSPVWCAVSSEQ